MSLTDQDKAFIKLYRATVDVLFGYKPIIGHLEAMKRLKEAQESAFPAYQSLSHVESTPTVGINS